MTAAIHPLPSRWRADPERLIEEARNRQRRRRIRYVLLLTIVILGSVIGYGISQAARGASVGPTHAPKPIPNPCMLLTNTQVSQAFASKVLVRTGQVSGAYARFPTCTWTGTPLTSHYADPTPSIRLGITRISRSKFVHDESRSIPPPVPINGVGSIATWSEISQTVGAWERGYAIHVSIYGPYVTHSLATAKRLAAAALAQL